MKIYTYFMREMFTYYDDLPESDLVTREIGNKAYALLRQNILKTALKTLLIFDFTDVLVMDSSFAGPSLLRLMRELVGGQYEDRYLALSTVTTSTKENIDITIRGHGLKLAMPLIEGNASICLLGEIEPNLAHTFRMVDRLGTMTARDLADYESIAISAASNRLKRLYDLRLITRTEEVTSEGRQHRYQSLIV
jgi:hypothetical protein